MGVTAPIRTSTHRRTISFEEFLETWPEDVHAEWDDGRVIELTVDARSITLQGFLFPLIDAFVVGRQLGQTFTEPFVMRAEPGRSGRSPDIFVALSGGKAFVQQEHLEGPADLVVEIVSPTSKARDRVKKYGEYERGGVREYWIVDRPGKVADFFVRGGDGLFHTASVDADGYYRSHVLEGFRIRPDWLWQEPLPAWVSLLSEAGCMP